MDKYIEVPVVPQGGVIAPVGGYTNTVTENKPVARVYLGGLKGIIDLGYTDTNPNYNHTEIILEGGKSVYTTLKYGEVINTIASALTE